MSEEARADTEAMSFSSLLLGFSSAALSYMGMLPGHEYSPKDCNSKLAKQNIDILVMLQEKTKGNLSGEEDVLLRQILTDLRVKYVEFVKQP